MYILKYFYHNKLLNQIDNETMLGGGSRWARVYLKQKEMGKYVDLVMGHLTP